MSWEDSPDYGVHPPKPGWKTWLIVTSPLWLVLVIIGLIRVVYGHWPL